MKSTVSERGQVTIPKDVRDRLGIRPGQILEFSAEEGRLVATKSAQRDPVDAVYGILGREGSTDELVTAMRGKPDGL
ncbi:MAG: AbrB/MazE/SpoVT family DNA-binding domain-containing protein [Solirubrobacterales bacterium]|jgi:AbrB family looped-hinge helix DNA binding protein|nr:AbrB/MazE/SpoVT family DNA-binding domain-containing protein [Solirubrobacterales bacterium]